MRNRSLLNSTVITAYLLILSISYLWGFWSNFKLNILQFINLSDIIKSVIIPMITSMVMYFIQLAISIFNTPKGEDIKNFKSKPTLLKIMTTIQILYIVFFGLLMLTGLFYTLIFGKEMHRYVAIGLIIAGVISVTTADNEIIRNLVPGKDKKTSYFIICLLPILFLSNGIYNGEKIIKGKDTFFIESNSKCTSDPTTKYRFIDSISDKAFAISLKDNSICVFKYEYIKLIKENNNTKQDEQPLNR